uniref:GLYCOPROTEIN n=1 Tax=Ghana virus TaxID=2847089 RepID=UPI0005F591DB|nr:Chain A, GLYCOPROTEIN [Ghana virus]4UF7_B Chain B, GLYCOPROTEIN [Ghana virus]
ETGAHGPSPCRNFSSVPTIYYYRIPGLYNRTALDERCILNPRLTISSTKFAYVHSEYDKNCTRGFKYYELMTFGEILEGPEKEPRMFSRSFYSPTNAVNYHSCTPIVTVNEGYFLCLECTSSDPLYKANLSNSTFHLVILRHNKDEKIVSMPSFNLSTDQEYVQIIPAEGGGTAESGNLYFPCIGRLLHKRVTHPLCKKSNCSRTDDESCLKSYYNQGSPQHQVVNCLIRIRNAQRDNPTWDVITVDLTNTYPGSRSRIFGSFSKPMLYQSSVSWHTLLQVAEITDLDKYQLDWLDTPYISRPGGSECPFGNYCPTVCWEGTYNDVYSLTPNNDLFVTVYLKSEQVAENPYFAIFSRDQILKEFPLDAWISSARTTTISCFMFNNEIWCIAALEITRLNDDIIRPIYYSFWLPTDCRTPYPHTGKMTRVPLRSTYNYPYDVPDYAGTKHHHHHH